MSIPDRLEITVPGRAVIGPSPTVFIWPYRTRPSWNDRTRPERFEITTPGPNVLKLPYPVLPSWHNYTAALKWPYLARPACHDHTTIVEMTEPAFPIDLEPNGRVRLPPNQSYIWKPKMTVQPWLEWPYQLLAPVVYRSGSPKMTVPAPCSCSLPLES